MISEMALNDSLLNFSLVFDEKYEELRNKLDFFQKIASLAHCVVAQKTFDSLV